MPGLMDTPMAIGGHSSALDVDPEDMRRKRNNIVPLGKQQGTGWVQLTLHYFWRRKKRALAGHFAVMVVGPGIELSDVHAQARPDDPAYIMSSTNDIVTWSELR